MTKRRPRGRPREVHDPVRVSVLVPGDAYDSLDLLAKQQGTTVPKLLRFFGIKALKNRQRRQRLLPSSHLSH